MNRIYYQEGGQSLHSQVAGSLILNQKSQAGGGETGRHLAEIVKGDSFL